MRSRCDGRIVIVERTLLVTQSEIRVGTACKHNVTLVCRKKARRFDGRIVIIERALLVSESEIRLRAVREQKGIFVVRKNVVVQRLSVHA